MVLEKTLESPMDCREIKSVNPKGSQFWIFIGRTDAEGEIPILWPLDVKNWLICKDPILGKIKIGEGDNRTKWLNGILNSMDMSLNRLWELVMEKETWHSAVHGFAESDRLRDWTDTEMGPEWLKAKGEGDNRGWDGWMASPTQWAWVWVNSRRWWKTGKPGVLQSTVSRRVRHTERLNNNKKQFIIYFSSQSNLKKTWRKAKEEEGRMKRKVGRKVGGRERRKM